MNDFAKIKQNFKSYWSLAWPSVLISILKSVAFFCLLIQNGDISRQLLLPVISVQVYFYDLFFCVARGYE